MKMYIIRHGETDFNRRGIVQGGGVDSDLNDLGRRQANAFFEHYRHISFDALYVSPLKRTHQTLQPWFDEFGYVPKIEPGLTELSWGILEGRVPTDQQTEDFIRLKQNWEQGKLDLAVEGGESPQQCWNRLQNVLETFKQRHLGESILVCSHGRTSRVLLAMLAGKGMHEMEKFPHSNTGLNIIRLEDDDWVTDSINDTLHLKGMENDENQI